MCFEMASLHRARIEPNTFVNVGPGSVLLKEAMAVVDAVHPFSPTRL